MAKQKTQTVVDVTCPKTGCGHKFEIEVPAEEQVHDHQTAGLSRQDILAEIDQNNKINKLETDLQNANELVQAYQTGRALPDIDTMLAHITSCPDCTSKAVAAFLRCPYARIYAAEHVRE